MGQTSRSHHGNVTCIHCLDVMHLYITMIDFYKRHSLKKLNWKCGYSINKSYSKPVIRNLIQFRCSKYCIIESNSKYWIIQFSITPSSEYSGLIYFRIDWFDLLAVQRTLKSLLQHHSSKASILQCSACFMVQLSYPYMTTGKTIALTIWAFVSKVTSLLFNVLSLQ